MIPRFDNIPTDKLEPGLQKVQEIYEFHRQEHHAPDCPMEIALRQEMAWLKLELLDRKKEKALPRQMSLALTFDEFGELLALASLGGINMAANLYRGTEEGIVAEAMGEALIATYLRNTSKENLTTCDTFIRRLQGQYLSVLEKSAEEYDASR